MSQINEDLNLVEIAKKWQLKWQESKLFEPSIEKNKEKFFFTVPYPYVSGLLHAGHGRTYTIGDVFARFYRMNGKNVLWPMAFHITGTPVLAISAKIKANDLATISLFEEYVGVYESDKDKVKSIVASFVDPWNIVNYFSEKLVDDFQSMGFSLDLSRRFTSGDKEYNRFINWQFKKYQQKGYLKQASYPILYCLNDKNAVGEDDIKDGDSDPVEVQRFIGIKFKLIDESGFLVSSTLRPETVFGITNEFVNPQSVYFKIKVSDLKRNIDEIWYVSEQAAQKLSYQQFTVQVLEKLSGESFVGKFCLTPLGKQIPILPAEFVDPTNASGFVHSVPAHAPFDYAAIEELKENKSIIEKYQNVNLKSILDSIIPVSLISVEGYGQFPAIELCKSMKIINTKDKTKLQKATKELYKTEFYGGVLNSNCLEFSGQSVTQAKDNVAIWLKEKGFAFDLYETSRPATCRCSGQVISAVLNDQWFIDFNSEGWKELSNRCLENMEILPKNYKKQFQDVFNWLDKRPCARRRGLGTQLPFNNEWIIESLSDSTIYMAFYTIIKQIKENNITPEQLTESFFDFVFLGNGDIQQISNETKISSEVLIKIQEEFLYWYPNDLRHTSVAHITNHLSFFIFAHTAIFAEKHWPKAISLNELVICEGTKMSKSKGNVVLLNDVSSKIGPDVFRLYAVSAADSASVLDYRAKEVDVTKKIIGKLFVLISNMQELKNNSESASIKTVDSAPLKWFESKFESAISESTLAIKEFRIRDYVQYSVYQMINNLEYFLRRANVSDKIALANSDFVNRWIALISPIIPHFCEEMWSKTNSNQFVSVSNWPKSNLNQIDWNTEAKEDLILQVLADARKIKEMLKGKKSENVTIVVSSQEKRADLLNSLDQSTAELASEKSKFESNKLFLLKNFYALKSKEKTLLEVDEYSALLAASDFLSKETGLKVFIVKEEDSQLEKASKAVFAKPALVLN